jgi:hypothetical protein
MMKCNRKEVGKPEYDEQRLGRESGKEGLRRHSSMGPNKDEVRETKSQYTVAYLLKAKAHC